MTLYTINDHRIEVPEDMVVDHGNTGYPGAYDCIRYKGIELGTFECDFEPKVYTGPFACYEGEPKIFKTLNEARTWIDGGCK